QAPASGKSPLVDAFGKIQITHAEGAAGRIGAETERTISRRQITAASVRGTHRRHADVRRQILARPELMTDHGSHAGILHRRAWTIAGEHVVRSALVGSFAV